MRAFSRCGELRLLLVMVHRLLIAVASLIAELWRTGLVAPQHVESSWTRVKPVSPALAGGFLTTGLPGNFFLKRGLSYMCDADSIAAQFSDNVQGPSLQSWGCHTENGKYRARLVAHCRFLPTCYLLTFFLTSY